MKTLIPVRELVEKKVSRQEFMKIIGFGLLTIVGFSAISQMLTGKKNPIDKHTSATIGYGHGAYNR